MKKLTLAVVLLVLLLPFQAKAEDTKSLINDQKNLEFQVDGKTSVVLAAPGSVCDSTTEGAMYYDKVQHSLVICNGTDWATPGANPLDTMTWHDKTASRSKGVTYTNTTGHAIFVNIIVTSPGSSLSINQFYVNGAVLGQDSQVSIGETFVSVIVPPNGTYSLGSASTSLWRWYEYY